MKVFKPDELALMYRAYRFNRRNLLAVAMMGYFDFARSDLASLLPEADMWQTAPDALGADVLLDEGNAKPRAEFKVYGAAHAPLGREVSEQRIAVRIGGLAKSLIVSGERQFGALGMPGAPKPYARMPVVPETAFGGADCADNPRGKGSAAVAGRDGREIWPLPNVEGEGLRLIERGQRVGPAGFWGLPIDTPQRRRYLGKCDQRWLATDWPHLPADTRLEYFMSAPQDQWIDGYFKGDEAFEIQGMHARQPVLKGSLPRLRARCFVHAGKAGQGALREVAAHAETVWLFPELERGIVLYRALADVADPDALDVSHLMAEWESMDAAPLSFEHYRARFHALIEGGDALAAMDADAPAPSAAPVGPVALVPSVPGVAVPDAAAAPSPSPALAEVDAMAAQLEQQTRALMAKHGIGEQDVARFMPPAPPGPASTLAEVDRTADDLDAATRALMQKHNLTDADVAPFLRRMDTPSPAGGDGAALPALLRDLDAGTQLALQRAGLTESDARAWAANQPALSAILAEPMPSGALPDLSFAAAAMPVAPSLPAAGEPSPPPAQRMLTRETVIAMHAARSSLAACDLSGIDLSALDLCGADFSGALLHATSFAKSRLEGADFSQALLMQTDFTGADLRRARLAQTSGGEGRFTNADLRGAKLSESDFTGSDFSGARLEDADLSGAQFDGASMTAAHASNCNAALAQFIGCALDDANFAAANLTQASFERSTIARGNFAKARCAHADFQGTQAPEANFAEADLSASRADAQTCFERARLTHARLNGASWEGVQLTAAALDEANLDNADLSRAAARTATLRRASAKGAKFSRADLSGADLSGIDLFKGSLRLATLQGTFLTRANLYGVDFEDARPTLASVEGSNIERTLLTFRPPAV